MLLGQILWLRGDLQAAWQHYADAVKSLEQAVALRPDHLSNLHDLEEAYRRAGDLLGNPFFFHFDDPARARRYYDRALEIAEKLAARDPRNAAAQAQLSTALRRVAVIGAGSEPAASDARAARGAAILESLLQGSPDDRSYRRDLANARLVRAMALRALNRPAAAAVELEQALSAQRDLLRLAGEGAAVREDMFETQLLIARVRMDAGATTAALTGLESAIAMAREMVAAGKEDLFGERCLALGLERLGEYHAAMIRRAPARERPRHAAAAAAAYREALSIWSRWRRENLAHPYSVNREKQVTRALAALRPAG
jgi:tetratricopeptide (TPR) repeat protein